MSFSEEFFGPDGAVSVHLDNFEPRPQQIEMAKAVEETIEAGRILIVEAGTGTGKTFAYLVPFIVWARENRKKVVISTYTKALQNQLYVKDLPLLRKILGVDFNFSLCMGSENYTCLRKARKAEWLGDGRNEQFDYILRWLKATGTGLVTDMEISPDKAVWDFFSRDRDLCLGKKCAYWDKCFFRKARSEQAKSEILITNHSLTFTDIVSGSKVLPDFDALVLDEAHTVEDVATDHFGREVSSYGLRRILETCAAAVNGLRLETVNAVAGQVEETRDFIDRIARSYDPFKKAEDMFGVIDRTIVFDTEDFAKHLGLVSELAGLSKCLDSISLASSDPERSTELRASGEKARKFAESMKFIFGASRPEYAYWLTVKTWKTGSNFSFHASPVDVSGQMREFFFERLAPVVLTSATLTSGKGDFSFIKKRLGIDDPLEVSLDSPFDYGKNVLLYLPGKIADPVRDASGYKNGVKEKIIELYGVMGGRIMVLFTSYEMLNSTAREVQRERSDIELLKQGDMPRYVLLDIFKNSRSSVLFGTNTFWQGVDVPGDALECVVITKLPFAVPTDPVNAARIEAIRREGGDPFSEYQMPQAVIMLKQGFGRLIRTMTDRGVVAILDPRVNSRHYGRVFIDSLPRCRKTADIEEVTAFLSPR